MAHNCHGKRINLTTERITSRQKKLPHGKRTTSRQGNYLAAKIITLFFLPCGYFFAVTVVGHCTNVIQTLDAPFCLSGRKPESKLKRFYSWFCGYDAETEEAKRAAHEQHERLATITSLERNPYAETFLNINVIIILAVGLYLYIFFSI